MADKKVEKALYGPSTTEVALGAVLGLVAGVLVASVYLIFKPVEQVRDIPKEPVRGTIYFIPGGESSAKSRDWSAKLKQFTGGGSVQLVEEELNAWAASALAAKPAAAPAAAPGAAPSAAPAAADGGIFQPGTPNFKVADGKLRIGFKCLLNWYGLGKEVFVVTTGSIVRSGDGFAYKADSVYLGSCPVHLLPAVSGPLVAHLIGKKSVPDDLKSAWAKLSDVTIEGSTLTLSVQ